MLRQKLHLALTIFLLVKSYKKLKLLDAVDIHVNNIKPNSALIIFNFSSHKLWCRSLYERSSCNFLLFFPLQDKNKTRLLCAAAHDWSTIRPGSASVTASALTQPRCCSEAACCPLWRSQPVLHNDTSVTVHSEWQQVAAAADSGGLVQHWFGDPGSILLTGCEWGELSQGQMAAACIDRLSCSFEKTQTVNLSIQTKTWGPSIYKES